MCSTRFYLFCFQTIWRRLLRVLRRSTKHSLTPSLTFCIALFQLLNRLSTFDLSFRTKNLPSTKANAAESNLWNLDSENEISSYVSKQLTASAKKGIAKAKNELTRASQNLISLATTASDVLDGEKQRTKHRRPRSKGGMVSIYILNNEHLKYYI